MSVSIFLFLLQVVCCLLRPRKLFLYGTVFHWARAVRARGRVTLNVVSGARKKGINTSTGFLYNSKEGSLCTRHHTMFNSYYFMCLIVSLTIVIVTTRPRSFYLRLRHMPNKRFRWSLGKNQRKSVVCFLFVVY
jgi:hypothetical protein